MAASRGTHRGRRPMSSTRGLMPTARHSTTRQSRSSAFDLRQSPHACSSAKRSRSAGSDHRWACSVGHPFCVTPVRHAVNGRDGIDQTRSTARCRRFARLLLRGRRRRGRLSHAKHALVITHGAPLKTYGKNSRPTYGSRFFVPSHEKSLSFHDPPTALACQRPMTSGCPGRSRKTPPRTLNIGGHHRCGPRPATALF